MRGRSDRSSANQRRSRPPSEDGSNSSELSTRSTVVRSRGQSNRWETESGASANNTANRVPRRRSVRDEVDDSSVQHNDESDDTRSEVSRYSYASSQHAPRSFYGDEASFLSQAMLGVSRQSLMMGEGSVRSRRSVRSGGGAHRRSQGVDDEDHLSFRSGGGGGGAFSASGRQRVSTHNRSTRGERRAGLSTSVMSSRAGSVAGVRRSHISVDGFVREDGQHTTTPTNAEVVRTSPARRGERLPSAHNHLTSTQLHAVETRPGSRRATAAATTAASPPSNKTRGGGRLKQLLSRAKLATSETLLDSNDGTVFERAAMAAAAGTERYQTDNPSVRSASVSTSGLFTPCGPRREGLGSSPGSSTTRSMYAQRGAAAAGAGEGGAQVPSSRLMHRSSMNTTGPESECSDTHRGSGRRGSFSRGSRSRSAGRGRGGILSYAHSRLARRPVLVWRQPFRVTAMATTLSGRLYTGGDPHGAIVAWDSRTGGVEFILEGHQGAVLALELLASQDLLLSGSADHTARLWSLQTLQTLYTFEGHSGLVSSVAHAWVEDLESMAFFTGSDDTTIRQWSIERGGAAGGRAEGGVASCLHIFKGHRQPVNALCCLEDATHVLSGDGEGLLRVWSTQAQKCVCTLEAHEGEIMAIKQLHVPNGAPTSAAAAHGGEDGVSVYIVTAGNGASGTRGGCVRLWQANWMQTTVLLAELCVPDLLPSVRCVLAYHHFIFVGGSHGEVLLWDTNSDDITALFVFHTQAISALTLHNNQLCSCSFDHHMARWDALDLLGAEQQSVVPYQPYGTGAFLHTSTFLGGSVGAAPQTVAMLRGSRAVSRQAQALVASSGLSGNTDSADGRTGGPAGSHMNGGDGYGSGVGLNGDGGNDGRGGGVGGEGNMGVMARSRLAAAAAALGERDVSAAEAAETYAELPLAFVLEQLGTSRFNSLFYLNFAVTAVFCVIFCVLFAQLYPVAEGFFIIAGLEAQLVNFPLPSLRNPRTFSSISSVQWFYRWMDVTVQHLWRDRAQTDMYPTIAGNNVLLSTMRLRVKRMSCDSCQWNPAVIPPSTSGDSADGSGDGDSDVDTHTAGAPTELEETARCRKVTHRCYADWGMHGVRESTVPYLCPMSSICFYNRDALNITAIAAAAEVNASVGFTYSAHASSRRYTSVFASFDQGGYVIDFFYTDAFAKQRSKLAALETLGLIDDISTRLADVSLFTYNPNMDIFTMSVFACEVPSAGAWMCTAWSNAFEVYNSHTMKSRLGCHIVLLLLTLAMAAMAVGKLVAAARAHKLTRRLLSVMVWIDAVVVVLMLVLTGYFFRWVHVSASLSVRELVEVTAAHRRADLIAKNAQQRAQLTELASLYRVTLRLAGVTAIGVALRVLSSVTAISYLRVFTNFLRRACPLLVGFAVMHTILLMGFAQAAHLLYGRTMLDYSNLGQSFMTLVHRQWGSGDARNSIEVALAERWTSSVFFFFFFALVFCFMATTFLIALLLYSYTETAKSTAVIPVSQTLWKRAHDVRFQLRWQALRRSWLCQHLRRFVRRCQRWLRRRARGQLRGPAQFLIGNHLVTGLGGAGGAGGSIGSSNAALLSSASSLRNEHGEEDDELMDGADALAERHLIRLLRKKLEEVGLGDGAEDEDNEDGTSGVAMSEGLLSASVELSGRWGRSHGGSAIDVGASSSTLSSSANSSVPAQVSGFHQRPPTTSAIERRGRTRGNTHHGWSTSEAVVGLGGDRGTGGDAMDGSSCISDRSRPATLSSAREASALVRRFGLSGRSTASGTAVHSDGAANSSVLVEHVRTQQQDCARRLQTVMVRKTDIAFLLDAVVEEATRGTARASETLDTFMDAYSRTFVDHLWEDLAWHYHYDRRSENKRECAMRELTLRGRVESALVVLGPSFALVDSAQRQLEAQEGHLWPLVQALEQHDSEMRLNARNNNNDSREAGDGGEAGGVSGGASTVGGSSTRAMYGYSRQF